MMRMACKMELVQDDQLDHISGGKSCIKNAVSRVVDGFWIASAFGLFNGAFLEIQTIISDLSADNSSIASLRGKREEKMKEFCDKLNPDIFGKAPLKIGTCALGIHDKIVDAIRNPY